MAPRLRAEITGPTEIRITLSGLERPTEAGAYRLTDGHGHRLAVAAIGPGDGDAEILTPAAPLDALRVHYIEIPAAGLRALVRRDPIFRRFHSDLPLGAVVAPDGGSTTFRIFSPRAGAIRLFLYAGKDDRADDSTRVIDMTRDDDGVWSTTVPGNLHGTWYDFTVHGPDDPGNAFFETHPVHISDPYARVNDDALGKSRVWVDGPPPPPVRGGRPPMESVVAYEVHVQDFTDLLPVDPSETGTLPAMTRAGLRNAAGQPVGFDHLVELGVNVVHLMPVQEYLHYPDDEWRAAFGDDDFAREMGIDRENYQWGYRTTHPFAVESRFRTRGSEPGTERAQFKALVEAFHERGLAVIIDLVPNHTGEDMDHRHMFLHFNVLDRPYYYRTDDDLGHIGPFGNELKTEDRPMVQRWLLDQMRHWIEQLGVDGFRIDLAGQLDKQTLRRVREELPDDVILYGEPWIPPSDPDVRANPEWSWYKSDAPITFFQDDARNAFQGSPFHVSDRGWAGGRADLRDAAMAALANAYAEEPHTTSGISYLDVHDNWALADRYALHHHNGLEGVDLPAVRIAAGLLLTSAGPVVIHGGTEMLRSKGRAPRAHRTVSTATGPIAFKGRDDTYNVRTPNQFRWETLVPGSAQTTMRDWWRGLLALRASPWGKVFRVADVPEGHYRWILPDSGHLLGYLTGERVLVLANNSGHLGTFHFHLPEGSWRRVTDGERADLRGVGGPWATLGPGEHSLDVPGGSFFVWVREEGPRPERG